MKRWQAFVTSLGLDQKVDFEEGDIGLAGGAAWVRIVHSAVPCKALQPLNAKSPASVGGMFTCCVACYGF